MQEEKYYTIKEVAEKFNVTTMTVRNWIYKQKWLKAYKVGRTVRIKQTDLDAFKRRAR